MLEHQIHLVWICDREIISYVATTAGISGTWCISWSRASKNGLVIPKGFLKIEWLTDNGSLYC